MAYNYEYPYVNTDLYNDDWLINKMKELSRDFTNLKTDFEELEKFVKDSLSELNIDGIVDKLWNELVESGYFADYSLGTLKGKKVIFLGDSLTYGTTPGGRSPVTIPSQFALRSQAIVVNAAVPSAQAAQTPTIAQKLWLITQIANTDFTNASYVFFNIGTNDVINASNLGLWGSNQPVTGVMGAIEQAIDQIRAKAPSWCQIIYFTTPCFYDMSINNVSRNYFGIQAAIVRMCAYKKVPYVDLSGVIPPKQSFHEQGDRLHMNAMGYEFYGNLLYDRFRSPVMAFKETSENIMLEPQRRRTGFTYGVWTDNIAFNAIKDTLYVIRIKYTNTKAPGILTIWNAETNTMETNLCYFNETGTHDIIIGWYASSNGRHYIYGSELGSDNTFSEAYIGVWPGLPDGDTIPVEYSLKDTCKLTTTTSGIIINGYINSPGSGDYLLEDIPIVSENSCYGICSRRSRGESYAESYVLQPYNNNNRLVIQGGNKEGIYIFSEFMRR